MFASRNFTFVAAVAVFFGQNLILGQTAPQSQPGKAGPSPAGASAPAAKTQATGTPEATGFDTRVDSQQAVITIRGLCDSSGPKNADPAHCSTVVTKEQFEALANALNPGGEGLSAKGRQTLAQAYTEALTLEAAARKSGLEETPQFHEVMNWIRLRTATELYRRNLREQFAKPTQPEIDAYYQQHHNEFDRVKLMRVLIPRESAAAPDKNAFDKKALETANTARERAAKGDDPVQIQKDAYAAMGLNSPPPTDLGNYARANFTPKEEEDVFALKPGEVTQIEVEPKSYVIYKITEKKTLSEAEVQTDISRKISQQKFSDAIKEATNNIHPEFSQQYFGPGMQPIPAVGPAKPSVPPAH